MSYIYIHVCINIYIHITLYALHKCRIMSDILSDS